MGSSSAFRFKRSSVYGLPTLWGAMMFAVVGLALWFSISSRAPIEQWISFLMILVILLHLSESNIPFRDLSLTVLASDPPFAGEKNFISVNIVNPSGLASEPLRFRVDGVSEWTVCPAIAAKSSKTLQLPLPHLSPGKQVIPSIRMQTRPASQLFQLWSNLNTEETFCVLPEAIDHGVPVIQLSANPNEAELSHFEPIRDERLLFKMDAKLFAKTGKAFYRAIENQNVEVSVILDWLALQSLTPLQRPEQFSSWLKESQRLISGKPVSVQVDTPFFKTTSPESTLDWREFKQNFADWLYGKS